MWVINTGKNENSRHRAIDLSKLKTENSRNGARVEIELATPVDSRCTSESRNHTPLANVALQTEGKKV